MGILAALHLRRSSPWDPPTTLDTLLSSPLHYLATHLYHLLVLLRGHPFQPPPNRPSVRVVCVSDTHDLVPPCVPAGDLLVHCGDLTQAGRARDVQAQIDWLAGLPHTHKVVVAGNHDRWFDVHARADGDEPGVDLRGLVYLENSGVELSFEGGRRLNVWGGPAAPRCGGSDFAFQYDRQSHPWKHRIPDETDVLLTHTPPRHHLDLGLGCGGLLEEVWRVRPRLHVFGHVHWGRGREAVYFDECQRAYETIMARPSRGWAGDMVPHVGWLLLGRMAWHGLAAVSASWLMPAPGSNDGRLMVNAALTYGNTGRLGNRVQVVDL